MRAVISTPAVMILALSACSELDYRYVNPPRVNANRTGKFLPNADYYLGKFEPATVAMIQQGSFDQAWAAAACAAWKLRHPNGLSSTPDSSSALAACAGDPASASDAPASAKAFLMSGVAASDRLCAQWFDQLSVAQAHTDFTRDLVSSLGGLAAAASGLAGASTAAVAGIGAGTGFLTGTLNSAEANFIVAPDIGVVQQLITDQRKNAATDLDSVESYTYEDALRMLIAYDSTCSHQAVKRAVNQSVTNSVNRTPNATVPQYLATSIQSIFAAGTTVTTDDVVSLYAIFVAADVSDSDKAKFQNRLVSDKLMDKSQKLINLRDKSNGAPENAKIAIKAILGAPELKAALDAAVKGTAVPTPAPASGTNTLLFSAPALRAFPPVPVRPKVPSSGGLIPPPP
jgi:hypothetical protein